MKSNKILILVLLILSSVILVACKTEDIVSHGGPTKDYVSLIDSLRVAGATVEPALENPTNSNVSKLISTPPAIATSISPETKALAAVTTERIEDEQAPSTKYPPP